jgi:tRNA dimethylallyltransferase
VIVGPTAVGKTGLITALAAEAPLAVISLDSRQIYRGLRIGTAQPTAAEQAACPHHLVDFLPPEQTYSAQRFREDFTAAWGRIVATGGVPVLAGGAGLYLRAVTEGLLPLPADAEARLPGVRAEIQALPAAELDRELGRVDPDAAARLHPNDRYRRERALEIFRLAGRPLSELTAAQRPDPAGGLEFAVVRLERPVAALDRRIAARTEAMLAAGWVEETRALLRQHPPDCPGLRSLGYAEVVQHLAGELAGEDLAPAIARVTRQYAKRQRTWFRRTDAVASGAPEDPAVRRAAVELVAAARERLAAG